MTPRPRFRPRLRRSWWASFLVFAALGGVWALASPLYSVPDEPAHAVRAAAASRGSILPAERTSKGYSTMVEVPKPISYTGQACFAFHPSTTANCAGPVPRSTRPVQAETSAGLYPPAFYTVVGVPTLLVPSGTGIYLMRFLSAAICAALIASAVLSLRELRSSTPHLLYAGLAVAVTPQALFLFGSVNPNGVEIASALCLWASLGVVVALPRESVTHRLLARVAVSGAILALTRPGSPLWVVVIVGVLAAWAARERLMSLLADRATWLTGAVVGVALAATLLWVRHYGTLVATPGATPGHPFRENVRIAFFNTPSYLYQMVGTFGWLDSGAPTLSVYLWFAAGATLVLLALAVGRVRDGLVLAGLIAAVVLLPVILQLPRATTQGFPWQGRYTMPVAVGVPILAALQIDRAGRVPADLARRLAVVVLALVAVGQVFGHIWGLRRYTAGIGGPINWIAADGWDPPLPAGVLFGLFLAAVGASCYLMLRLGDEAPALAPDPSR